jgi:hypothetical protein
MRLRNSQPAFGGAFSSSAPLAHLLTLNWQNGSAYARLEVDLATRSGRIIHGLAADEQVVFELR